MPAQRPLNELRLDVWTVDRGLPHNTVLSLAQTADGYLWIGTWEGLVRFDGAHFGQLPESTPLALREAGILALAAAADGSLWIGTMAAASTSTGRVVTAWSANPALICASTSSPCW
ncbi:MAG: hypothetical protein IPO66_20175 [Rhodanobacteraceae bacterium]|nr:hypothetical protein [Rhodanobacteraceae bacterium]